jgi:hypothetical protein
LDWFAPPGKALRPPQAAWPARSGRARSRAVPIFPARV